MKIKELNEILTNGVKNTEFDYPSSMSHAIEKLIQDSLYGDSSTMEYLNVTNAYKQNVFSVTLMDYWSDIPYMSFRQKSGYPDGYHTPMPFKFDMKQKYGSREVKFPENPKKTVIKPVKYIERIEAVPLEISDEARETVHAKYPELAQDDVAFVILCHVEMSEMKYSDLLNKCNQALDVLHLVMHTYGIDSTEALARIRDAAFFNKIGKE